MIIYPMGKLNFGAASDFEDSEEHFGVQRAAVKVKVRLTDASMQEINQRCRQEQ